MAFAVVSTMSANVWSAAESVLLLFGGDFSGARLGPHAAVTLLHLAGVTLAAWGTARALRRFGRQDLIVQVLAMTAVVLLAAYVLRGTPDATGGAAQMAGLLPVGAVLAGRLLAGPLIRGRLVPALALILACYSAVLVHDSAQPWRADPREQVAAWLAASQLSYGLAGERRRRRPSRWTAVTRWPATRSWSGHRTCCRAWPPGRPRHRRDADGRTRQPRGPGLAGLLGCRS